MDDSNCISYEEAGMLAKLTRDYLAGNESLDNFYQYKPNLKEFETVIQDKSKEDINREILYAALSEQYAEVKLTKQVRKNLESLKLDTTFTIVTGHQLCLFTGPLYFIYKIVSVVNLVEKLRKQHPEYSFVPVYWMASEDHDFDEINHTFINGERYDWNPNLTKNESGHFGKVGAVPTEDIKSVIADLENNLPDTAQSKRILKLLKEAYLEHKDLASATRFFVHNLFGEQGVLCVDGDHSSLKRVFAKSVKRELLEQLSYKKVSEALEELNGYKIQVNPREINLFYMIDGVRERIERIGEQFSVVNTSIEFSESEILDELEQYPERFSPNVILRPLYQETILPNLAYIGGGAEVAYWLEMRKMFEAFAVNYPMVLVRNSGLVLHERTQKKIHQLGLELKDVFRNESDIVQQLIEQQLELPLVFEKERTEIELAYQSILNRMKSADLTLEKSVASALQIQRNHIDALEKKLYRAEKKNHAVLIERIRAIKSDIQPNGGLQERTVNIIEMWLEYGDAFIDRMKEQFDPLSFELTLYYPQYKEE